MRVLFPVRALPPAQRASSFGLWSLFSLLACIITPATRAQVPVLTPVTVYGVVGVPITPVQVPATGSPTAFLSILADYGLSISNTGVITGTPKPTFTSDAVRTAVQAQNASGLSQAVDVTLCISPTATPPVITSVAGPPHAGTSYSFSLQGTAASYARVHIVLVASPPGTPFTPSFNQWGVPVVSGSWGDAESFVTFAGTYQFAAELVYPGSTTVVPGSRTSTYSVTVTSTPGVPQLSNLTINGEVGTPLAQIQLQATNNPTGYSIDPGLTDYGLWADGVGEIGGTPTRAVSGLVFAVTAYNSVGTSDPAYITLNIAPASAPTSGSGGSTTGSGGSTAGSGGSNSGSGGSTSGSGLATTGDGSRAIPVGSGGAPVSGSTGTQNQIVSFNCDESAGLFVGVPVKFSASSTAGIPVEVAVATGDATLADGMLTPLSTAQLTIRFSAAGNDTYAPASGLFMIGSAQQRSQTVPFPATMAAAVHANVPLTLPAMSSAGLPLSYAVVSGPASISGSTLTFTGTGPVVIKATQSGTAAYAAVETAQTYNVVAVPRLVNISTRMHITAGDPSGSGIAGFVVGGSTPRQVLIRAVGPALVPFGVSDAMAAPTLRVFDAANQQIAANQGWAGDPLVAAAEAKTGAFQLTDPASKDAAVVLTLAPGSYTAEVPADSTGSVLIETYDATANDAVPTDNIMNISARGTVDALHPLVAGFVVGGVEPKRVLIRGVGPALVPFGLAGALANPAVTVRDATGTMTAQNDDWSSPQNAAWGSATDVAAAAQATGAFGLSVGSKDAAVLLTLKPGSYTAAVTATDGGSGTALVEVYEVP